MATRFVRSWLDEQGLDTNPFNLQRIKIAKGVNIKNRSESELFLCSSCTCFLVVAHACSPPQRIRTQRNNVKVFFKRKEIMTIDQQESRSSSRPPKAIMTVTTGLWNGLLQTYVYSNGIELHSSFLRVDAGAHEMEYVC
eukprot:scaffold2669_cov88-Cylindrotheca_fusiformis.AAC.1